MNIERIKELMKQKGITQKELGEAAGVSQPFIDNILRGLKIPSVATLKAMAVKLGCTVDELLN